MRLAGAWLVALCILAGGCDQADKSAQSTTKKVESEGDAPRKPVFDTPAVAGNATPMADRVATLGFLNKRNNETRDLEMKPGESQRIGPVIVRLKACERTAPWEPVPETGAFVQVDVQERASNKAEPKWKRIFSGWFFKQSPSLNVVEHPIYDVWVKNCAMSFPGEEAPAGDAGRSVQTGPTAAAPSNVENAAASAESPSIESAPEAAPE